jgi:catechol 2,3-dioxygenase-like lactoylglutathione lyase family enzyme
MAPLVTHTDFYFLPTRDFERALAFYGDVLGLEISSRSERHPVAEVETGNLTLQIIEAETIGLEFNRSPNPIALRVDDVAAAREELESQGVQFEGDIIDSGVCHMAVFRDPDGHALLLHHRYAPR